MTHYFAGAGRPILGGTEPYNTALPSNRAARASFASYRSASLFLDSRPSPKAPSFFRSPRNSSESSVERRRADSLGRRYAFWRGLFPCSTKSPRKLSTDSRGCQCRSPSLSCWPSGVSHTSASASLPSDAVRGQAPRALAEDEPAEAVAARLAGMDDSAAAEPFDCAKARRPRRGCGACSLTKRSPRKKKLSAQSRRM